MLKIGIECESIEGPESWGVGRIVKKLLEEISKKPELQNEFRFFLYFKSSVPDLPFLDNPIFVKKVIGVRSFSLYYYVCLPIKLWFERLNLMYFPNYMLPLIFRGKSLVMLTEDIYYEITAGSLPFRYKLAYRIFAGNSAKHATKITAISNSSKKEVAELFKISPERIVVNELGVEMPHQVKPNPNNGNYVLYVGQAFPRRHLKETMLAFEIISPEFPDLKLIAIGKDKYNPPLAEKLKSEINLRLSKDAIIYKEYVEESELLELYAGAKAVIYVSSKEAFGLPPLEALGYGVPPVVSDQPVTREIFNDKAFFVSNPDNPDSIATAIVEGLKNEQKRRQIIDASQKILARYTWPNHTNRFLEIIKNF